MPPGDAGDDPFCKVRLGFRVQYSTVAPSIVVGGRPVTICRVRPMEDERGLRTENVR
jgi:hypothetical protein